jgi:hypothetical protein
MSVGMVVAQVFDCIVMHLVEALASDAESFYRCPRANTRWRSEIRRGELE